MLSHRLRTFAALVPALAIAGMLVASPGFAAQSLRITSPLSATTVDGSFEVAGVASGGAGADVSVALAAQVYGDCTSIALEQWAEVDNSGEFATSVQSAAVADGVYCVVVTVDGGLLSSAVGDITVNNASVSDDSLGGTQLLTAPLEGGSAEATDAVLWPTANLPLLAPSVVGAAATLAVLVVVLALLQRRRTE